MKKITIIAITAIVCSAIIGGSLYAIQINKQKSIERQTQWELEQEKEANATKATKEAKEDKFANELKCQGLLKELKARWNNVTGIYYSSIWNTCMVKYTDTETGEDEEGRLEDMSDN